MLVSELRRSNADAAIPTVSSRKTTFVTDISLSITHLSTYLTPFSVCIRLVQPENAVLAIEVTLSGMVMLVSEVQLQNAELPIEVTLSGMIMLVREAQL